MTNVEPITMIRVRIELREKLKRLGLYGDTYDIIIDRLVTEELKRRKV